MLFEDDDDFIFGDVADDSGFGLEEAVAVGTGYALFRHGQDRQTRQLIDAIDRNGGGPGGPVNININLSDEEDQQAAPVNAMDYADTANLPEEWEDYIGQEPLKDQLLIYIESAKIRKAPLPHVLLASGYPGVGKTHMARLLAKTMGVKMIELVPPFNIYTLVEAARQLGDKDILFIDEIHKLADNGKRGAEILLKVLEDRVAFLPNGDVVPLKMITVIGATTDRDKLPEPVVDRFKIKPYFQAYDDVELARIAVKFAWRLRSEEYVDTPTYMAIANACRGTPRIVEEMIIAARDIALATGKNPTPEELLGFLEVEPDGLTRVHIHYLTAMRQYFARETKDGGVEYIVGEAAIQQILRETKQGIGRIERFLVERGLLDRTPRGRRLTALGIARAEEFIRQGKGASDVA